MKAFEFGLQKLLDLKISQLEILKLDISKMILKINNLKKEIVDLGIELKNSQDKMEKQINEITEFQQWMNYVQSLYIKRNGMISELVKVEDNLEELKNNYVSLYKEKKALENLRSIQKSQYDLEQLRSDQKIIDEMSQKHNVS